MENVFDLVEDELERMGRADQPRRAGQCDVDAFGCLFRLSEVRLRVGEAGFNVFLGLVLETSDLRLDLARRLLEPVVIGVGEQAVLAAGPAIAKGFELLF